MQSKLVLEQSRCAWDSNDVNKLPKTTRSYVPLYSPMSGLCGSSVRNPTAAAHTAAAGFAATKAETSAGSFCGCTCASAYASRASSDTAAA